MVRLSHVLFSSIKHYVRHSLVPIALLQAMEIVPSTSPPVATDENAPSSSIPLIEQETASPTYLIKQDATSSTSNSELDIDSDSEEAVVDSEL